MASGTVEREHGAGYASRMKSFANPGDLRRTLDRLRRITPESERRWGTMTPTAVAGGMAEVGVPARGPSPEAVRVARAESGEG
jgi:hypothetical protein